MPPSRSVAPRAPQVVVTTTVFADGAPTAPSSLSSAGHTSLPIGAIVGGLVGGVFLALAAVGVWVWWGKSIEKKRRKQPRLRSALKNNGRSTPSVNASKHSLPRQRDRMASLTQKSVSFAPVPTSEDGDVPRTSDTSSVDDKDKSKPPSAPPPSRTALRSDRASYVPVRPSPLAHTTHPSPPDSPPMRVPPGAAPPAILHPVVDPQTLQHGLTPPRQLSMLSADGSSGVSMPSEYSQEGTASDITPPFRMLRPPDGRLYAHPEHDQPTGT